MQADRIFILLFSALVTLPVMGQDEGLTLFEGTEQPEQPEAQVRQPERGQRNTEPAFSLKGTARFGDNYSTSLVTRDGQTVTVDWKPSQRSQVGGYRGFSVIDIQSRSVTLELPAGEACIESEEKGVSCTSGGRMAVLSLATAAPIAPPSPEPAPEDPFAAAAEAGGFVTEDGDVVVLDEGAEPLPLNPFSGQPQVPVQISEEERRARAERQAARVRALQNFQPVRIPDEEVPEGMRKVSTPFGDRLVPEEQN